MTAFLALPPEARRLILAGLVVLAYGLFCVAIAAREALRRAATRKAADTLSRGEGEPILVAFASQTGFAEDLAAATARALSEAGAPVILRALAAVTAADLTGRALFVVSTTGEGDAPDSARAFLRDVMKEGLDLSTLRFAVLALGDSTYANPCAFGRSLDAWLARSGATPLFDRVEVDDGDPAALRHWQGQLATLTGVTDAPDWTRPTYDRWVLADRALLNPGSPGGEAWAIRLTPPTGATWQAGDILEVSPRNDPDLPHREYSIASLPSDGAVELIVRLMPGRDGGPGLGSGWLCRLAEVGQPIDARIRTNRSFHAPETNRPLILIGSGTGLAGLRAHLKARAALNVRWNWLVFGERTQAHDYFHRAELEAWRASGLLDRLDLAFSRDQDERIYVQHRLREAAAVLRRWVANGAAIYVCGSLEGMSRDVHAALVEILGGDLLERLTDEGRYRRDVY